MAERGTGGTPIIIGVGQHTHRPADADRAAHVLDLIPMAVKQAEVDAGLPGLARRIDDLCLVNIISLAHENPPEELARRLDAAPKHAAYTWIGATAPQWFVNRTAERISSGQTRLALICGGESFRSRKLRAEAKKESRQALGPVQAADGPRFGASPRQPWMAGDLRDPLTELEMRYGLMAPIHIYPLFEQSLRRHEGLTLEEHRRDLGEFCARFSAVASENPYAWFPKARTASEIVEETAANRMVSFPYTVNMCAIMAVDQSAALFMTDTDTAAGLGVPEEKWVYLRGAADAGDVWHVSRRIDYHSSPSVKAAADQALAQAGLDLDRIDYLDFYSCFPSPARITRNMLGLSKTDPRPLTVTGGLPYFGGPGNNYALHAISRMVELIRRNPDKTGLVQALSWFINKHSVGVYSGRPGDKPYSPAPVETCQAKLDGLEGPPLIAEASGPAEVETYTLFHDRQGRPMAAVVIGRLENGSRFLSRTEPEPGLLTTMTREEFVGRRGRVSHADGLNTIRF
ncbi:MAG: acetyl-CoA acetyltransferase [Proteobacteria bacterium]|nr:acetyl-CoA acetyltransferase [Pseudomonadota bacterium]